jgi:hypothetical protein
MYKSNLIDGAMEVGAHCSHAPTPLPVGPMVDVIEGLPPAADAILLGTMRNKMINEGANGAHAQQTNQALDRYQRMAEGRLPDIQERVGP